jgi:hypothetical protein
MPNGARSRRGLGAAKGAAAAASKPKNRRRLMLIVRPLHRLPRPSTPLPDAMKNLGSGALIQRLVAVDIGGLTTLGRSLV